ncbi:M48 family metallopeptidase [Noviherbaspirillum galbum]|uniref:M48 family metallopeptidase n=1 Tax=Noviherbaspirillum galbum TaxID=2709383 RepID=A0A6B3SQY5_9BURK|nr:SprT family zinc-dependent metalloprotease [Noviherbaspirillum galbum]NEX60822.1 M48 family metallopeptidase [Noviherbaspirillum galbum]
MKLLRQTPPDSSSDAPQPGQQLDLFAPVAEAAPSPTPAPAPAAVPVPPPAPAAPGWGQPFQPARDPLALSPSPGTPSSQLSAPGNRRIQLESHVIEYRLVRSKRRSIGFVIDEDGLRITAPRWVTIAELENAIREKQRWILSKLTERRERSARRLQAQMRWEDGGTLPFLGRDLTLRIRAAQGVGVAFDGEAMELTVSLPPDATEQQLKDRVQGWLQREAKRLFGERLPLYAEKLGVAYHSFALSSATTQWGSCTAQGKIRLNWRLIHFALPQIDYVIAHELAHLREMNHSPRFWATVQSIFPEFEAAKRVLRDSGPETLPIF